MSQNSASKASFRFNPAQAPTGPAVLEAVVATNPTVFELLLTMPELTIIDERVTPTPDESLSVGVPVRSRIGGFVLIVTVSGTAALLEVVLN